MKMKGQAALEFLMTYGWAILIIIAVVAALYAMGVFKLPTGGIAPCSPCFPPGSDMTYISHNASHVLLRVGTNTIKIEEGGQQKEYTQGSTLIYLHKCGNNWPCQANITYFLVVDGQEMLKTATITLHKTW